MEKLKIQLLNKNAKMPIRSTNGSAGYDLFACIDEEITIKPNEIVKIKTGIAVGLDDNNFVALIYPRSGLSSNHGIGLANSVGVVDSDYRGEIIVALINQINREYVIKPNDRIAQMVISPVYTPQIELVDELDETLRGNDGYGSTGR